MFFLYKEEDLLLVREEDLPLVQEEDLLLVQEENILLVQEEDPHLVQEEDLLLVQEEDLLLVQEEDLLLVQEEDLLLVQKSINVGLARVGTIWAQLAESRPAQRLHCFSGIPTRANYRRSEIDAFGGIKERVGQILAGQGLARPLIISEGQEYSSSAQICPTLLKMNI